MLSTRRRLLFFFCEFKIREVEHIWKIWEAFSFITFQNILKRALSCTILSRIVSAAVGSLVRLPIKPFTFNIPFGLQSPLYRTKSVFLGLSFPPKVDKFAQSEKQETLLW